MIQLTLWVFIATDIPLFIANVLLLTTPQVKHVIYLELSCTFQRKCLSLNTARSGGILVKDGKISNFQLPFKFGKEGVKIFLLNA